MPVAARAQEVASPVYEILPRGRNALPPEVVAASQRRRLLEAMAEMSASKGIGAVTVDDVITRARVSRKSFYALFKDKTDCYLAGFTAFVKLLIGEVRAAAKAAPDPVTGVLDGFRAYLQALSANSVPARAYLFDGMRGGGPEVAVYRERIYRELVAITRPGLERAGVPTGSTERSVVALVGAINELVCRELYRTDDGAAVMALLPDVVELTLSVLRLEATG
jgi:AcrR family transcriptional regulator